MEIDSLAPLESLKPTIKARWKTLLREIPSRPRQTTAVVMPEMLVLMIDDTLTRLTGKLRCLPDRASISPVPTHHQKAKTSCQCGLNLLMNYYLSGVRALRDILRSEPGLDRRHICRCFNLLAREEVLALASICRFRGSATCGLRPLKSRTAEGLINGS